jgi:hypothetical protein
MQPADNIGSEPAETSKKGKTGKATTMAAGTSKSAKATDVLAQRKAEAAKTTLPPVAKKTTKLIRSMRICFVERLMRQRLLLRKRKRRKLKT